MKKMNGKEKKWLSVLLAASMLITLTACSDTKDVTTTGSEVKLAANGVYPVECADELTVWSELNATLSTRVTNFGDTELAKDLEERTGIKVTYIHPAQGQGSEQFNLMIASNELPDIIQHEWYNYGAQTAIDSGYILSLNDIIDKWAPNLKKVLSERPEIDKTIKTDEGNYYVFPFLRESSVDCIYSGPIVRQDWLDKLNMEAPETIEEWEKLLWALKKELNVDIPFSASATNLHYTFAGAYGIFQDMFVDSDGKAKYGPALDEWKEYLTQMHKWYNEGLIDKNIASFDQTVHTANILNGRVGATFGSAGGGVGKWMNAKKTTDATFKVIGVPYPVAQKGEVPKFANQENVYHAASSYAISGQCKNPELAARFLDYGYSEEGRMLYNFGVEGESYTITKDGYPKYDEALLIGEDNGGKLISMYVMGNYSGPFVQDSRVVEQVQNDPKEIRQSVLIWADNDMEKNQMPLISFTAEEQTELSNLRSEIKTYTKEMTMKFITGIESLDKFEKYQEQLKKFKLDRMVEIYNQALKRFNAR